MALKKATFSFTARYALQRFLNRPHVGMNVEMIEKGLEFYEKLNLAFIQEWVRDNSEKAGGLPFSMVLKAEIDGKPVAPVTVRIDESYLNWLRDQLKKHDWGQMNVTDPRTGGITSVTVGVALELQVCIGALSKAINEAISGKDVKDETELAPAP